MFDEPLSWIHCVPTWKKSMALSIKNVICVNYTYAIFKTFFDLINTFKNYNVLPGME